MSGTTTTSRTLATSLLAHAARDTPGYGVTASTQTTAFATLTLRATARAILNERLRSLGSGVIQHVARHRVAGQVERRIDACGSVTLARWSRKIA